LFYIDVSMRVQMTICWRKAYAIALTVAVAVVEKRVTAASSGTSDGACGGGDGANKTVDGAGDAAKDLAPQDIVGAYETSDSTSDRLDSVGGRASVSLGRVNSSANSANNTVKGVSDTREEGTRALQEASSDGLNRISDAGSGITGLEGASDLAEEREELGLAQLAEVKTVGKTTVEKTLSEGVGGRADGDAVEQTALAVKDAIDDRSGNLDALDGANKTTLGIS
jgi:hypothetical protein